MSAVWILRTKKKKQTPKRLLFRKVLNVSTYRFYTSQSLQLVFFIFEVHKPLQDQQQYLPGQLVSFAPF